MVIILLLYSSIITIDLYFIILCGFRDAYWIQKQHRHEALEGGKVEAAINFPYITSVIYHLQMSALTIPTLTGKASYMNGKS